MEPGSGIEALCRPSCFGVSVCRAGESTGRPERCQATMTARSGSLPRAQAGWGRALEGAGCSAHRETPRGHPLSGRGQLQPLPHCAGVCAGPLHCSPSGLFLLMGSPPPLSDPRPRPLLPEQGGVRCSTHVPVGERGGPGGGRVRRLPLGLTMVGLSSCPSPLDLPNLCMSEQQALSF